MVAVRQVKTGPWIGRPARRGSRARFRAWIAARLCRPDVFSMTSGIQVRDGGLPRRPGARRQGRGGLKVIIAPDGGDAWAPAKPRPDETLIRALARAHRWQRCSKRERISRPPSWRRQKRSRRASSIGCSDLRCLPRISSRQSWRSGSRRGCNCRISHGRCRVCGRRSERRWVNYNRSGSNR
jgi:hypothetical protein